jgi:diguanylate cyclase (GGDEF)-like protein/hemerythrin-like metal-binding protein
VSIADILGPSLLLGALAATATAGWWRSAARRRSLAQLTEDLSTENVRLQEDLAHLEDLATHDRLTGAWNRRRFEEAAAAEMGLARRRHVPLSLIMVDLDHFKRINDTYGHPVGDVVLAGTTAAFLPLLRASDLLARWGGEEFLILAPGTDLEGATRLAERLRVELAQTAFPSAEPMTLSAGVAEYHDQEFLDGWVARVDAALYRAKAEGRNRVVADETPSPRATLQNAGLLELIWEEAYCSGHKLIDSQHIYLFDLSNALLSALLGGQPPSVAEARLDSLLTHTEKHFHDEEALLRKAGYSDLDHHRAEHARLLATARHIQGELKAGKVDFGGLVTFLVTDLVKGHFLSEDRNYFAQMNDRLGPEPEA